MRHRVLAYMGVALGLHLGAKLYVPGITFLLVMGFLLYTLAQSESGDQLIWTLKRIRPIAGAVLIMGFISGIVAMSPFGSELRQ